MTVTTCLVMASVALVIALTFAALMIRTAGRQQRLSIPFISGFVGFLIVTGVFASGAVGLHEGNRIDQYHRKCAAHGGVILHDYCFKPGSEIHI